MSCVEENKNSILIRFCSHCFLTLKKNPDNIQWHDVNFCNLKCFSDAHVETKCKICKDLIPLPKVSLHSIKIGMRTHHFCSSNCSEKFKENKFCAYCFIAVKEPIESKDLNKENVYFCSETCLSSYECIFLTNKFKQQTAECSLCKKLSNIEAVLLFDGDTKNFCSMHCLNDFEKRKQIQKAKCSLCQQYYSTTNNQIFVTLEGKNNTDFCSGHCLDLYEANSTRLANCKTCDCEKLLYNMIRNSFNKRLWCSIGCAEKDLNENPCSKENLNVNLQQDSDQLTSYSEEDMELEPDNFGVEVEKEITEILSDNTCVIVIDDSDDEGNHGENNLPETNNDVVIKLEPNELEDQLDEDQHGLFENFSKTVEGIPVLNKKQVDQASQDYIASYKRYCNNCSHAVPSQMPSLIWQTMDFCNTECLESYVNAKAIQCIQCLKKINYEDSVFHAFYMSFSATFFCDAECLNVYKNIFKFCACCQIKMCDEVAITHTFPNNTKLDFCTKNCAEYYQQNHYRGTLELLPIKHCHYCKESTTTRLNLLLDDCVYNFCSPLCFLSMKSTCKLRTVRCAACENFFVRKTPDSYTIRFSNEIQVFCGALCMAIYIRMNRKNLKCSECESEKENFDMIQRKETKEETSFFCKLECLHSYDNKMFSKQNSEEQEDEFFKEMTNMVKENIANGGTDLELF